MDSDSFFAGFLFGMIFMVVGLMGIKGLVHIGWATVTPNVEIHEATK